MKKRGSKKGLSDVVTTVLIVLLILATIATIWIALGSFIGRGVNSITLGNFGIDMIIESASIDYTAGIATVKVARNPGLSDEKVTSIHFIVEDRRNSDVFKENVGDFKIYEKRTFYINLTTSTILNISEITKISIAPVFISSSSGVESLGPVTGGQNFGGNVQVNSTTNVCTQNTDCGVDYWIEGSQVCDSGGNQILKYKKVFECFSGFCQSTTQQLVIETCLGSEMCYSGTCIPQGISCSQENVTQVCGTSGFVGFPKCNQNPPPESIKQQYRNLTCQNGTCKETITEQTTEMCLEGEVCGGESGNPECFEPVECTANNDCILGEVCNNGECVPEEAEVTGNINSIWPFTLGEYFDSTSLPKTPEINFVGHKVIFPGSSEGRCLTIKEYVYPNSTTHNSYVRLNISNTNITSGDYFEIWETAYACTFV
ncbi:MAG: hypothetical protein NUV46_03055 [Nanoarchaeota archaeon]|nr:hypothetical protein [Nanoarchaeota archaeon]